MTKMVDGKDLFNLTGRRALITGASRGIGLALAEGLAQCGALVAITSRKEEDLQAAAAKLRTGGATVLPVVCHQGDPRAIQALFDQLDQEGFTPDITIINAATNPYFGPLLDIDLAAWQKILDVNLTGAWLTIQQAARRMVPRRQGSIILVASVAGLEPFPGLGAYSVSKSGLLGLARALARELAPSGIRVNALAPGLVETRFSAALFQDRSLYERLLADIPMGRHGQPNDLVGTAVFLASEASAYMTGQVLVIDGGSRV
jgi:NAD(P)-dependent dehydrogenase (short-subunit alcohol dehydrogenase family)